MARQPSYKVRLHTEERLRALEVELGAPSRSVIAGGKFHVYDLIRSHGFDVPEQYGRWDDPADITWDALPDLVVIKSARGAASHGVLPLKRSGAGWQIVTHDGATSNGAELAQRIAADVESGTIHGPFAAEEFLLDEGGTSVRPPTDVKAYAFYGEVPLIQLRQSDEHGNAEASRYRMIDPHGVDLLHTYARGRPTDTSLDVPQATLDRVVEIASHLSVAIRAPFSRIDMYGIGDRIVFGEVTPRPGPDRKVWFGPELDASLGEAWERAQVRLWRDLANGMSPEPEWGPFREKQPET